MLLKDTPVSDLKRILFALSYVHARKTYVRGAGQTSHTRRLQLYAFRGSFSVTSHMHE